jgi:hypothetical protein
VKALLVLVLLAAAAFAAACADDASDDEVSGAGVARDVFAAIDAHARGGGLDGATPGLALAADCAALGPLPALCIDAEASTVLATEATVLVYENESRASWTVTLLKREGRWRVTHVVAER